MDAKTWRLTLSICAGIFFGIVLAGILISIILEILK